MVVVLNPFCVDPLCPPTPPVVGPLHPPPSVWVPCGVPTFPVGGVPPPSGI